MTDAAKTDPEKELVLAMAEGIRQLCLHRGMVITARQIDDALHPFRLEKYTLTTPTDQEPSK